MSSWTRAVQLPLNSFSTTMVEQQLPPTPPQESFHVCPRCGNDAGAIASPGDSQKRIQELEQELSKLTSRASAAADKAAEYETQLRKLSAVNQPHNIQRKPVGAPDDSSLHVDTTSTAQDVDSSSTRKMSKDLPALPDASSPNSSASILPTSSVYANSPTAPPAPSSPPPASGVRPTLLQGLARSFSRRASPATPTSAHPPLPTHSSSWNQDSPSASPSSSMLLPQVNASSENVTAALETQLQSEHASRIAAETKLKEVNAELEELSATLFSQANEMVAEERRARAESEKAWEKKLAEQEARSEARARESQERARDHNVRVTDNEGKVKMQEQKIKRLEDRVKTLEIREKERTVRLERLEKAIARVSRLKGLLETRNAIG